VNRSFGNRGHRTSVPSLTALAAVLVGLLAGVPAARAATSTWTGLQPTTSSPVGSWTQAANWSGGVVPGNGASLSFPRLAACDSAAFSCYTSLATYSPSVDNLSIGDDLPYELLANNGITLTLHPLVGQDGLDAAPTGAGLGSPYIADPLVLSESQQWSVAGNGAGGGGLAIGSVTSATASAPQKLAVTLTGGAQLFFDVTVATGGLTVTGAGSGAPAQNGLVGITRNANTASGDGPIDVDDAALLLGNYAGAGVSTGPVAVQGGALTIGAGGANGPGEITVTGTLGIDTASSTTFELEGTGTTPGSSYGQLVASGNVTLGGQLTLSDEGAPSDTCPAATVGSVDTFIRTTGGTLTGTFANLPNGAITSITAHCADTTLRYPVQLHYTPTAVTGTFLAPTATSTALSTSATSSVVGGNVTFSATVNPGGPGADSPTGAVRFLDGTTPISCSTGGLLPGGSPAVATCTTPGLPVGTDTITAVYGGDGAWVGSTAPAVTVTVDPAPVPTPTTPYVPPPTHELTPGSGVPRLRSATAEHGAVRAAVSCAGGGASCAVRLRLLGTETVRRGRRVTHRTIVLGETTRTIAAGHRRTLTMRLGPSGRRLLARTHVLKIKLVLQRRLRGRLRTVGTRTVTLRAPGAHTTPR
jgi:hypothetical protein